MEVRFGRHVAMRRELEDQVYWREWMRSHGRGRRRVIGAGAAAKATVWLNFMGFNSDQVAYVVDSTPTKWGKFISGTDIRIEPHVTNLPDDILIFAHNYVDEVVAWLTPQNVSGAPMWNVATREQVE